MSFKAFLKTLFGVNGGSCSRRAAAEEPVNAPEVEEKKQQVREKSHEIKNKVQNTTALLHSKLRELETAEAALKVSRQRGYR